MVDSYQDTGAASAALDGGYEPYDQRRLSYGGTFSNPVQATAVRALEWLTGKATLIRLIRKYERQGVRSGQPFFDDCLRVMGIDLLTPPAQIANIPAEGPVVLVANHPHGLVDGMVLASLIGRVRLDYKVLARSLLTQVPEVARFMIPVAFPHDSDALKQNVEMREATMSHLGRGGLIALFPAGRVATSEGFFGPAVEPEWNPFTAKMIRKSGATVVPVHFQGQNSRLYQIANQVSATLRQGLLLHEVRYALNKPQAPVIGAPIAPEELEAQVPGPREMMAWLRARTLSL